MWNVSGAPVGTFPPCCVTSASCSCCVLAPFSGHYPAQKVTPVAFLWPGYLVIVFSALSFPHSVPGQRSRIPTTCWLILGVVLCRSSSSPALCAHGWDAGEVRCPGPCRSPQGGDAGMRDPFCHTTTGNMAYIPVMAVGNKGAVLWQPEGRCPGQVKISVFRMEGFKQCVVLVTL